MPRVVVAPDKFKGSCSASEAAAAMVAGLRETWGDRVDAQVLPLADGGEGTVAAFLARGGEPHDVRVADALGRPVTARYARRGTTAVIEMAAASGLAPLRGRTDPRAATTFGTGQLIADALDGGATRIVLGIGGSATTDGGAGALAALGVRFRDASGAELASAPRDLVRVAAVDPTGLDSRLAGIALEVACDVDNPLTGPEGAAAVYGPQKGATPKDVAFLEAVLTRLAEAAAAVGRDLRALPGAGAAGGLGWGLATFCGARLVRGFDVVAELAGLDAALQGARWCLTGEGRIDASSLRGKVVGEVAARASAAGAAGLAVGGEVEPSAAAALAERGMATIALASGPAGRDRAMRDAPALIRAVTARWARARPAPP